METAIAKDGTEVSQAAGSPDALAELSAAIEANASSEKVIESRVEAEIERREAEREVSLFQRKLRETRAQCVQPIIVEGAPIEQWFVTRFSGDDVLELAALAGRMGKDAESMNRILVYLGTVKGYFFDGQPIEQADNTERFFASLEEVDALFEAKGWGGVTQALITNIAIVNSDISELGKKKQQAGL